MRQYKLCTRQEIIHFQEKLKNAFSGRQGRFEFGGTLNEKQSLVHTTLKNMHTCPGWERLWNNVPDEIKRNINIHLKRKLRKKIFLSGMNRRTVLEYWCYLISFLTFLVGHVISLIFFFIVYVFIYFSVCFFFQFNFFFWSLPFTNDLIFEAV